MAAAQTLAHRAAEATVAKTAYASGLPGELRPADMLADIKSQMYHPRYSN